MTTVENHPRSPVVASQRPALEIRFQFVDGSKKSFIQADAEMAESIRQRITPARLFNQSRIVIADDYSKSVFVCAQINRVDFVFDDPHSTKELTDHSDPVELTEAQFTKRVPPNDPSRLSRRVQPRQVGDPMVSMLDLRMRGGTHVYLVRKAIVKLPAESQSYMQSLLSKGGYSIRLLEGGQGVLNLQNLISYTVYPGFADVPADTWMAQPKPSDE